MGAPGPVNLSVLVAFRDREPARVERFLEGMANQTLRDFEVVFVDYGSRPDLAREIQRIISARPFARYAYNETRGMPWNRAHALNSAARLSSGQSLLCTDIDLIYSRTALEALAASAPPGCTAGGRFFLLPRSFGRWMELLDGKSTGFPQSHANTLGAIQLVPRDAFLAIGGFDEFYRIWGVEDFDFQRRLARAGCQHRLLELPPIYHQWHPAAARSRMPTGWLELMNFHALTPHQDGNERAWGRLLTPADRPALTVDRGSADVRRYTLPAGGWRGLAAWAKIDFLRSFLGDLERAGTGSVFLCEISDSWTVRLRLLLARTLLRRRYRSLAGHRFFDPVRDGSDLLWYAALFSPLVADYCFEEGPGQMRWTVIRR